MDIAAMEPMVPEEDERSLDDLVVKLAEEAGQLAARTHPILQESIGNLVRSMNC